MFGDADVVDDGGGGNLVCDPDFRVQMVVDTGLFRNQCLPNLPKGVSEVEEGIPIDNVDGEWERAEVDGGGFLRERRGRRGLGEGSEALDLVDDLPQVPIDGV